MTELNEDEPILIRSETEFSALCKRIDDIEDVTHVMVDPPTSYPCLAYYRTDYSDWNGYENDLYFYYFYIEHARELYAIEFLGEDYEVN